MCASACSCILSKFYIKPQQPKQSQHRTASCILSKFYIKPQLVANAMSVCVVVSYRNSTSNHNSIPMLGQALRLYLIEILHQTTTRRSGFFAPRALYLIEILHQTTTATTRRETFSGCILSKFYIKPQHFWRSRSTFWVVSYRNSTSNHNGLSAGNPRPYVVSYRNSTSNHNTTQFTGSLPSVVSYRNSTSNHNIGSSNVSDCGVVSYRNSTSNHNSAFAIKSATPVVSYRNSTSNHNSGDRVGGTYVLYLIEILHQTTTANPT